MQYLKLVWLSLSTISFSLICTYASGEPITLKGINLGMTKSQIEKILNSQGYKCGKTKDSPGDEYIECQKDDFGSIGVHETKLEFSCMNFDACGLGIGELAQELVDAGIVYRMEYDAKESLLGIFSLSYCGRGDDGDRLCVTQAGIQDENFAFKSPPVILIEQGRLGKPGLQFN